MSSVAKASQSPHMASVLLQIADEIRILAQLTTFTKAVIRRRIDGVVAHNPGWTHQYRSQF
jgi:hypothetical protein